MFPGGQPPVMDPMAGMMHTMSPQPAMPMMPAQPMGLGALASHPAAQGGPMAGGNGFLQALMQQIAARRAGGGGGMPGMPPAGGMQHPMQVGQMDFSRFAPMGGGASRGPVGGGGPERNY